MINTARLLPAVICLLLFTAPNVSAGAASPPSKSAKANQQAAPVLRLNYVLWREVQNNQGETLGSVSDVLVQMPSGKIVFVAVVPSGFFQRPKTLPPGAFTVPRDPDAALRVDITLDRWLEAPRIDWDPKLIVKNTEDGARIYAYYQQRWAEPEPDPEPGLQVVATKKETAPPLQYVSLKDLLLNRVTTSAWEQAGYLNDFLIDWSAQRATHALVLPQFTPLAPPDAMWFAIPVPLLNPPVEDDAITVNSGVEAFRTAPTLQPGTALPEGNRTQIFRYPRDSK